MILNSFLNSFFWSTQTSRFPHSYRADLTKLIENSSLSESQREEEKMNENWFYSTKNMSPHKKIKYGLKIWVKKRRSGWNMWNIILMDALIPKIGFFSLSLSPSAIVCVDCLSWFPRLKREKAREKWMMVMMMMKGDTFFSWNVSIKITM